MTDDLREEQSAIRRALRRIEDEVSDLGRDKADQKDVRPIVEKQSSLETDMRAGFLRLASDNDDIRRILKGMVETLSHLDDRVTKVKRDTADELQAVKSAPMTDRSGKGEKSKDDMPRPFLPMQLQITLYILAGVGMMALIQNAPAALNTIPRMTFGG